MYSSKIIKIVIVIIVLKTKGSWSIFVPFPPVFNLFHSVSVKDLSLGMFR